MAFELLEHAPAHTSEEAARVRGTRLEEGAKALVVRAEDRHVHVVLPAHRRADNAALRAILGTRKLRPRIAFNAGDNAVSITMRADDFVRLSGATVCRFARE